MHHVTRLPNGLTIATAEMPHMASVSLGLWAGVGGRYEPAAWSGVSHFLEHMLFKGTRRRTALQIAQQGERAGGSLDAFTGWEHTCFQARARHDRFGDLLDVLLDMFLNSRFTPAAMAVERNVIKEELAMDFDQPEQHVQELLYNSLWPDQALGRPLAGTRQTLDVIGRAELLRFQRTHYTAANTVLAVAGHVRHPQVVRAVARFARHFHDGPRPVFAPAMEPQAAPRVRLESRPVAQTQFALGIRTCSRHDPRRFALSVLNIILGENTGSRLFQLLREEYGLVYSVQTAAGFFADTGDLTISAGLDTDNLPRALKLICRELRRLTEQPPGAGELRHARDYALGQFDLALEPTESRMLWLGEQLVSYGRHISAAATKRRLAAVTAAEVRAAARDFFRPERLNLALVSPLKRETGLARLLAV